MTVRILSNMQQLRLNYDFELNKRLIFNKVQFCLIKDILANFSQFYQVERIFKLQQGASFIRFVGLSVGLSVCQSVRQKNSKSKNGLYYQNESYKYKCLEPDNYFSSTLDPK